MKEIVKRNENQESKMNRQGATEALARLPGASNLSQIRASILKGQEIIVAQIRQAKRVLWTSTLSKQKNISFLFGGQVKMSFGQVGFVFSIKLLYLPEWTSGDKNLCITLRGCG